MQPSFDETITQWIDFLDQYTIDQLLEEPEPQSWSMGQVYIHLLDNSRRQLDQAKASLASGTDKEREMYEEAKVMFALGSFPNKQIQGPFTGVFMHMRHHLHQKKRIDEALARHQGR